MPRTALWTRRRLLRDSAAALGGLSFLGLSGWSCAVERSPVFIAAASSYGVDLAHILSVALTELGITSEVIKGKRILLKPNLVETRRGHRHINTHPEVVRAAAETFLRLGAARVVVAEGPGHRRDSFLVLEESGMADMLAENQIPFVDINFERGMTVPNTGQQSVLPSLTFPQLLSEIDWVVSMPKLKTHHWVGATLSMKNMFGMMPGIYYGWPKNVLHQVGIERSILDINATLQPQLAIVDGIVGMEGDGPIMGTPRDVGALIVGTSFPAVDATCARLMKLRPNRIGYLGKADGWLGPIGRRAIEQRGEKIASLAQEFELVDSIPAYENLR